MREAFSWYERCYGGARFWHTLLAALAD